MRDHVPTPGVFPPVGAGIQQTGDLVFSDGINRRGALRPGANDDLGIVRICLATQNLADDHAALTQAGVEFLSGPTEGVGGLADIAICRDPDGTLIELIEIHLEKWGNG